MPNLIPTLPSHPTEITETADTLLEAHRQARLSSSKDGLAKQLCSLDRLTKQLDNLKHGATIMQSVGPLAFWPARVIDAKNVYLREQDDELLTNLHLPPLTKVNSEKEQLSLELTDDKAKKHPITLKKVSAQQAVSMLKKKKKSSLQDQVAKQPTSETDNSIHRMLKKALPGASGFVSSPGKQEGVIVNQDNQVLNEQGLPFFEPMESVPDSEPSRAPGTILPFTQNREKSREDRRKWMDDIFGQLEAEEHSEPISPTLENRVVLRQQTPSPPDSPIKIKQPEVSSATRPPPTKSALKQGAARPSIGQRPSFGSTGIRRGFLNLNPSSPAAIKSNFCTHDLEKDERKQRFEAPVIKALTTAESSRNASSTSTPSKKTVRIQSPEGFRERPSQDDTAFTALQHALKQTSQVKEKNFSQKGRLDLATERHADDVGVEEEAARIVDLLGPDLVDGHPSAPPREVLEQMQRAFEEEKLAKSQQAVKERERREKESDDQQRLMKLNQKPALGQDVVERSSAFKRGFLNHKPTFKPVNPGRKVAPPTKSLGISPLDRASLGDHDFSKRREKMGLPSAVPHARPSKAYLEKMERQKQGLPVAESSNIPLVDQGKEEGCVRFEQDQVNEIDASYSDEEEVEEDEVPIIRGEGVDTDDDDNDDRYDTDDLMDLAPDMDLDLDEAFDNVELMREYARAKAGLEEKMCSSTTEQESDQEDDIVPLDATVEDAEYAGNTAEPNKGERVSRFKKDAANRKATPDLAELFSQAQNVGSIPNDDTGGPSIGPLLIIPSLAPVRFPKNGDLIQGQAPPGPVELIGAESDDDQDARAEMAMRSRIERMEWKQQNPQQDQPSEPSIPEVKHKKVSRFKASRGI